MNQTNTVLPFRSTVRSPEKGNVARHLLNSSEVARYCGVPREEVLGWIDSGKLKATHFPIDRYRIEVGDLIAFLHKFEVAI